MAGKIVVSPPVGMGVACTFEVYINGIKQHEVIKTGKKGTYSFSGNARVKGKVVSPVAVFSCESDEKIVQDNKISELYFTTKTKGISPKPILSFDIVKETPLEYGQDKVIFEFVGGVGDELTVYEDRMILKHKGVRNFLAMGVNGDKVVYYTDITGIQYKPSGAVNGYLQFSMLGGVESKGGLLKAASDENTIMFIDSKAVEARKIYDYLNERLRAIKAAKNASIIQPVTFSSADELKKFKELLDMGVITQEEFDAKKKELLGL